MLFGVIALALINVVYKGIGPALLGDRGFPARVQGVVDAFPAALLAGLIVVQLLGEQVADADWTLLPGLVLATFAWVVRLPQLVCVALAIAATIAVRFVV
jgi:uncharacterized membrane protein